VKKYGDNVAVDHLNFTVEQGQIYGFLGPNGAGKSTTMNIMTGYLGATEGEVLINGYDILKEPEMAKKSIGYLPELPPLYTDMTVIEYLTFVAELKKIKKAERQVAIEEVIQLVQIDDMRNRLIKNLSKGYRQRVGLAQAILGYPEVIILDEPMVGLDPKQIIEMRELIRELAKDHTVILSSHILAEVREVCDHVLIISKGQLVASDTPENLEKMLSGNKTIIVEAEESKETVEAVLQGIEGELTWDIREKEGITYVSIHADETIGRKEIFKAFTNADCALVTLREEKASLEDIFLEVTEEEIVDEEADDAEFDDEETDETMEDIQEEIAEEEAEDDSDL
jgi:ABC-2 type transport system ATP-binding protein